MSCFSVEVPTTIVQIPYFVSFMSDYVTCLDLVFNWIEENLKKHSHNGYQGWRSDSHAPEGGPESWATALVYEFLDNFLQASERCLSDSVSKKLGARTDKPAVCWSEIVDYKGFKNSIEQNIIGPIKDKPNRFPLSKPGILLFGPPGTGKSSVASSLAYECGWPLVKVLPADLLGEGQDKIVAVAKHLFKELSLLNEAVVFFDEFDEFAVSRDTESSKLDKLITTAMLPWFEELKREGKIVFIIATNHIERFDEALRRGGRFDLVLPVGPPSEDTKLELLKKAVPNLSETMLKEIVQRTDRRMTVKEVLALGDLLYNVSQEKQTEASVQKQVEYMNRQLQISLDTMNTFEKYFSQARY